MHAFRILQTFLRNKCSEIHAKRRDCLAKVTSAAVTGGLGVVKMGKRLAGATSLRHRIKCCDRLLSNPHLVQDRVTVYRALTRSVLAHHVQIIIAVDWSEIRDDGSMQLLRAVTVVKGRALTLYEEVHPGKRLGSPFVQRKFMKTLQSILPPECRPIIISDAGFNSSWFQMLNKLGFAWIGRIRNRHMVCKDGETTWAGCKTLYPQARPQARDLGTFLYVRSRPTPCRLVLYKRKPKGRHKKTKFGLIAKSRSSKKNSASQREPWLLAVSPNLKSLNATNVVNIYAGRMQIEQTFRDLKNQQWGMGLRTSQTTGQHRLAALLLIGVLLTYVLWILGIAARNAAFKVAYGSKSKAESTLSILSLATHWLADSRRPRLSTSHFKRALQELTSMVQTYEK